MHRRRRVPVRPAAALVAGLVVAAAGCSGGAAPGDDASPAAPRTETTAPPPAAPSPSPTPTPTLVPVRGEREPASYYLSTRGMLDHRERIADPDYGTVLPLVHAVGDWLDAHLDDLQRGGGGLLAEVAEPGLLDADPAAQAVVTTDLASAERPVASAHYRLAGAFDDAGVAWVEATVAVTGTDDLTRTATLLFVPDDAGAPVLVVFGDGGAAAEGDA